MKKCHFCHFSPSREGSLTITLNTHESLTGQGINLVPSRFGSQHKHIANNKAKMRKKRRTPSELSNHRSLAHQYVEFCAHTLKFNQAIPEDLNVHTKLICIFFQNSQKLLGFFLFASKDFLQR